MRQSVPPQTRAAGRRAADGARRFSRVQILRDMPRDAAGAHIGHEVCGMIAVVRAQEFLAFLKTIEATVPPALDLHLILDNYGTHKTPTIKRWLLRYPRVQLHFTPTSASWINLVELWFSVFTRKRLTRSAHRSTRALETTIRQYLAQNHANPRPFVWTKTADEILNRLGMFCKAITDSVD